MSYVDGYVLAVPKKSLKRYEKMANTAGKVWLEHGALEYKECAGDDLQIPGMLSFRKTAKAKKDETVVFAYVVYKSREHRDRVNKKVMKDPRLAEMCDPKDMPFDVKRMAYGGFKVLVDPKAKSTPQRKPTSKPTSKPKSKPKSKKSAKKRR